MGAIPEIILGVKEGEKGRKGRKGGRREEIKGGREGARS